MEFVFDLAVTIVSAGVVGSHIRAVGTHFRSERMPPFAKVVSAVTVIGILCFLWLTWALPQPAWAQGLGIAIELSSGVLFFSAIAASRNHQLRYAFDPTLPQSLVDTGPYRVVRHPFYVSYLVFWTGWTLAVWTPWAIAMPLVLLALYITAARAEERYFAASPLASDYAAYKQRTGFFIPGIG